jgi:beta-fructofuranosidase
MISQTLLKARRYEEEEGAKVDPVKRPLFHLSTRIGWMNDPNGFSEYNGKYHLFYQYYPYYKKWGPMHWGHAVTKDFLHWEYLPAALAPDSSADRDGCFSGSALTLDDGRQLLMYTGVIRAPESEKDFFQGQCIAVGDGVDYIKQANNPVLEFKDLPQDSNGFDFRDPKIWREKDGTFGCVAVDKTEDERGRVIYFKSDDGFNWHFHSILIEDNGDIGKMWECPDFFEIDGKYALLFSPQDHLHKGNYNCGNVTVAMIGEYDEKEAKFTPTTINPTDLGIDFYATQTLETKDGRRIMVAWMQNWDSVLYTEKEFPWLGQMTLPRELSVKDNILYQLPVRELETVRANHVEYKNVEMEGTTSLEGIEGRIIDLLLNIHPAEGKFQRFEIRFAQSEDGDTYTSLVYRPKEGIIEFDRSNCGTRRSTMHSRKVHIDGDYEGLKLRFVLDRYSSEIFINDGRQTITNGYFTDLSAKGISFLVDGKAVVDVEKYDLCL